MSNQSETVKEMESYQKKIMSRPYINICFEFSSSRSMGMIKVSRKTLSLTEGLIVFVKQSQPDSLTQTLKVSKPRNIGQDIVLLPALCN